MKKKRWEEEMKYMESQRDEEGEEGNGGEVGDYP